jgi:hypothetical protein
MSAKKAAQQRAWRRARDGMMLTVTSGLGQGGGAYARGPYLSAPGPQTHFDPSDDEARARSQVSRLVKMPFGWLA